MVARLFLFLYCFGVSARLASREKRRRPFDPALRDFRMNRAAARFTRSRTPRGVFMLIEVALNGGRTRAEHPGVPCSPDELAAAAKEAVAAGAGAGHFHVRAADGRESVGPEDVARAGSAGGASI